MGFWDGETCEYCGGTLIEKRVTLHRKIKGKYILIEKIPAGVCRAGSNTFILAGFHQSISGDGE